MKRTKLMTLLALVLALAFVAAACGEKDGGADDVTTDGTNVDNPTGDGTEDDNTDADNADDATEPTGDDATEPTGDDATEPTGDDATEPTGDDATEPTGGDDDQQEGDSTVAGFITPTEIDEELVALMTPEDAIVADNIAGAMLLTYEGDMETVKEFYLNALKELNAVEGEIEDADSVVEGAWAYQGTYDDGSKQIYIVAVPVAQMINIAIAYSAQ